MKASDSPATKRLFFHELGGEGGSNYVGCRSRVMDCTCMHLNKNPSKQARKIEIEREYNPLNAF